MRTFILIIVTFIIQSLLAQCAVAGEVNKTRVLPTCVGEFCFQDDLREGDYLYSEYGYGKSYSTTEESHHCYSDRKSNAFVKIIVHKDLKPYINGIVVSSFPICKQSGLPRKNFKKFRTLEGIALGDSRDRVVAIYGEPTVQRSGADLSLLLSDYFAKFRGEVDTAIGYGASDTDDLLVAWFMLKKNKVRAIIIGVFE